MSSCRSYGILALCVAIAGCASLEALPAGLTSETTPQQWHAPSVAHFEVSDQHGKLMGTFDLELTHDPARTCIAGEWRKAKPQASDLDIVPLATWWNDVSLWPSYQISGRLLQVELNGGGLCDAYTSVRAQIHESGGEGVLETSGLRGGTRLGTVSITLRPAGDPIAGLVARLRASRLWRNGIYSRLDLAATASTEQLIARFFEMTSFDQGRVERHRILETREVQIRSDWPDMYTAALVATNLGNKIVLLKYRNEVAGWWTRVYDADTKGQ